MTDRERRAEIDPMGVTAAEPSAALDSAHSTLTAADRVVPPRVTGRHARGDFLARYRIDGLLGEGGMGVVYRAFDPDLDRPVAIKLVHGDLRQDQQRLLREGQAVARLAHHPNVITVFDVGVHGGDLFIAMELVEGQTLRRWLAGGRREWREVMATFTAAGRGLAAAHAAGLVHRDFKPDNVLLGEGDRVVVSDFGLARHEADPAAPPGSAPADAPISATRTGVLTGTPAYMSPEQFQHVRTDARSDQFSFCVALWEALFGVRPFAFGDRATLREVEETVIGGRMRAAPARRGVPARIEQALRRGLAVAPADRFPSMEALLAAFEPRRRGRAVAIGAAVVAAAAVTAVIAWPRDGGAPAAAACDDRVAAIAEAWSPTARDAAGGDAAWLDQYAAELTGAYRDGCADPPRVACLDGALDDLRVAVARTDRTYWPRLRAIDRCGAVAEERAVSNTAGPDAYMLGDDPGVLVAHGSGAALVRSVDGAETRSLPVRRAIRWLPDGRLVGADEYGKLVVVDAATGAIERRVELTAVHDVSPDLRHAIVVDARGYWLVDVDPQAPGRRIFEGLAVEQSERVTFSPDGRRAVAYSSKQAILIQDLSRPAPAVIPVGYHVRRTGVQGIRWLDADHLLLGGSATPGVEGDLWRVRLDADGGLDGPPVIVRRGEPDVAIQVHDARDGRVVFETTRIAPGRHLIRGAGDQLLPGAIASLRPVGRDPAGQRVLGSLADGWAWLSLDDWTIHRVTLPVLDGAPCCGQVRDGRFAALVTGAGPPAYVEVDAAGAVTRTPLDGAGDAGLDLQCAGDACTARWLDGDTMRFADVGPGGLGAAGAIVLGSVRVTAPWVRWDVSPDRRWIAVTVNDHRLWLHDRKRGETQQLTPGGGMNLQWVRFLPRGALLYTLHDSDWTIRERDLATGTETVRWTSEAWIETVLPLDDETLLVGTVAHMGAIRLLDLEVREDER